MHVPASVRTSATRRCARQTIDILSTWGDRFYVGLSAIEMFDEHAQLIALDDVHKQVTADPADINVLPEYAAIASPLWLNQVQPPAAP
jgi:hypothetical protein